MSSHDEAAPAQLGSHLLAVEESHERATPASTSSGNQTIDRIVLDGGFRYGEITSIAGPTGTGKTMVSSSRQSPAGDGKSNIINLIPAETSDNES